MKHQRPEPRHDRNLPVSVFGMTAQGKSFVQKVRTQNISRNGALISGINDVLNVGDTIAVQLGQKKARFRVVWISVGLAGKYQVGLQMQDGQESPWTTVLPGQQVPSETVATKRRRRPRHRILINIEIRDEQTRSPLRATATDISGNGCYVESMRPFPPGTHLRAQLLMGTERLTTSAVVRTCDQGLGMGIEFMTLTTEQQDEFQRYLQRLNPGGLYAPAHASSN
jgi:c-di-GMP-binding flagellar brake protein YcgR